MRTGLCHGGWCCVPVVLALSIALTVGACAGTPTDERAQQLMRAGDVRRACDQLRALVDEEGPRERQLNRVRELTECLSRIGRLEELARLLAPRPEDGLRLYGEALLEVARSPMALGRALQLLARAEARWPGLGEIPYRAGILLLADEQPARALPYLQRACRLSETAACVVAQAHALLDLNQTQQALALAGRLPLLRPRKVDVDRGRALIQRIAKRSRRIPPAARTKLDEADQLLERDRAGDAIRLLEELLLDHPRLGAAHRSLGLAHLRLGNAADAVVALRRATELDPLDSSSHLFLAALYQSRGLVDESVTEYREALRLNPFLEEAAQRLGELLLQRGRAAEAAEILDRAGAVDGGGALSLRLAARAHLAAGKLDRAERCLVRLHQREPQDFETNLRLAQLLADRYAQQGGASPETLARAFEHLDQAAASRPADPELAELRRRLQKHGPDAD